MAQLMVAFVTLIAFVFLFTPARAATTTDLDNARDKGLAWLVTHQRGDGSWRSTSGTEFAATATAIDAFALASVRTEPYGAGVAWLSNATVISVDSLARQIATLSSVGLTVTTATQTLIGWRNPNTAWGAYDGYDTTFPDTALALTAIRISGATYSQADVTTGLCRILTSQKTGAPSAGGGSWSYTYRDATTPASPPANFNAPAILPTVYNLLEINALKQTYTLDDNRTCGGSTIAISTVTTAGINWLLSQRNADNGFGPSGASTVLETALAYQALFALAPTNSAVGPALDYLVLTTQRSDGSWNGDAFQTALVLKVIPIGTPYADADQDGIPDRVETVLGTDPNNVNDSRGIAPGNGLTSVVPPTPTNDFGIVTTSFGPPDLRSGPLPFGLSASVPGQRQTRLIPAASERDRPDPLALVLSTEAFQVDLYTGAAIAEYPIVVPPGTGGVAPSIMLRYDSSSADALTGADPAQGTGLGWTLITGPIIVRDHKGTTATTDDTFTLLLGAKRYDLVFESTTGFYHTKDETFQKLVYDSTADFWTLTTKDGTRYELGNTADSKQSTRVVTPWTTSVTYRYFVDAVTTTSNVAIKYAYSRDTVSINGYTYDRANYLDTITYTYVNSAVQGTQRQVTFSRSPRGDIPNPPTTAPKHFEAKRLDAITVSVGTRLVRKYVLGYDYVTIDRAPGTQWDGGATGDLALKSLTVQGTDAETAQQPTALPPATFGYDASTGRVTSALNGLGGQVTYGLAPIS